MNCYTIWLITEVGSIDVTHRIRPVVYKVVARNFNKAPLDLWLGFAFIIGKRKKLIYGWLPVEVNLHQFRFITGETKTKALGETLLRVLVAFHLLSNLK